MKIFFKIIVLLIIPMASFSQSFSENDIKKMSVKFNNRITEFKLNGVFGRACISSGRTLIFQYDVAENWFPTENMKAEIIENFKQSGSAYEYFKNDVNIDYYYFTGNKLRKKISIKSLEFSNLSFNLGEYIRIDDHAKSKGVHLKIKTPIGWAVKEGDRPNIVKKFIYKNSSYMIIIKDSYTFYSRKEAKELLADNEYTKGLLTESNSSMKNSEVINYKVVTVDTYPALQYSIKGSMERLGHHFNMIMKGWIIFYEDKIVVLQGMTDNQNEFNSLQSLYDSITNSVIFPEQYN